MKHYITLTLGCLLGTMLSVAQTTLITEKTPVQTIYAVGNVSTSVTNDAWLQRLQQHLTAETIPTTLLFLGDHEAVTTNKAYEQQLQKLVAGFQGTVLAVPGEGDWQAGVHGMYDTYDFYKSLFKSKEIDFEGLKGGCPIDRVHLNATTDVLLVDSEWVLLNWDKEPNINDHCEIKTKEDFYTEFEHEIVKSQGKTVVVAMHHPVVSAGPYSATFGLGTNPANTNNIHYRELSSRMLTVAQAHENVFFVSGHESNMEYLMPFTIPVIVAGGGEEPTTIKRRANLLKGVAATGFSRITEYSDGSWELQLYDTELPEGSAPVYEVELIKEDLPKAQPDYHEYEQPKYVTKAIYEADELTHSKVFNMLWGTHYRKDYKTPIQLEVALLDTLYGGLTPIRKGGGHQTNSLRLQTDSGQEYVMRNVKKSAIRFIQYFLFKTQHLDKEVADTYFIKLLEDYWTTAHPYASLTVGDISDAVAVYHANPHLYYIPKQARLGSYNEAYGDRLYFIEERLTDGHGDKASFGYHDEMIGTTDVIKKLRRKEKVVIDENRYIRSRLLDNVLGDFDRHEDQWRWAVEDLPDGRTKYIPIPRDRDQVFSNFDGFILRTLTTLTPMLRFMQHYDGEYKALRWFNDAGDDVDRVMLSSDTVEDWLREAAYIKEHLTDEVINKAFTKFPKELDSAEINRIKTALKARVAGIEAHAVDMYAYLHQQVIITGTDKEDRFVITRLPEGATRVQAYRLYADKAPVLYRDVTYTKDITKEIWIYGLDDEDVFETKGEGTDLIPIKIVGGQNNDTYAFENQQRIRVYDQKSKPNTFQTKVHATLTDEYDVNTYDFMKSKRTITGVVPLLGYNPDDGVAVGAQFSLTHEDMRKNPFTSKHVVRGLYYTATQGLWFDYSGEFANLWNKVNFTLDAGLHSPNYTNNYFGMGNETVNREDATGIDYYRVRLEKQYLAPGIVYRGYQGSTLRGGLRYEHITIEDMPNRLVNNSTQNAEVFSGLHFLTAAFSYSLNEQQLGWSRQGIAADIQGGYTYNLSDDDGFAYVHPTVKVHVHLNRKGSVLYAADLSATHLFQTQYQFYQAASLGASSGLRGYRNQRFSGQSAVYHQSDVRIRLGNINNSFLPMIAGIYGGFDYGRVWAPNSSSDTWHTSQGGGLLLDLADFTTLHFDYFNTKEGNRFSFGLSVAF